MDMAHFFLARKRDGKKDCSTHMWDGSKGGTRDHADIRVASMRVRDSTPVQWFVTVEELQEIA